MLHLKVIAKKLNKRNTIPMNLPDPAGIVGTVVLGYEFLGEEVTNQPMNPALGKWYRDRNNCYYWGGGLIVENVPLAVPAIALTGLPKNIPPKFRLGVDVSHHNGHIDWPNFRKVGVIFAIIKVSEAVGVRDKMAKINADGAKAQGLKIGYYHFCHPDKRVTETVAGDAKAEANEMLAAIHGLPAADLPLVIDLEDWNGKDTPLDESDYLLWVTTFLDTIKDATNSDCMIYSRTEYLNLKLPKNHNLGTRTKLWLSIYRNDAANIKCPHGWNDWAIWQYTDKATTSKNRKFDANIMKDATLF